MWAETLNPSIRELVDKTIAVKNAKRKIKSAKYNPLQRTKQRIVSRCPLPPARGMEGAKELAEKTR